MEKELKYKIKRAESLYVEYTTEAQRLQQEAEEKKKCAGCELEKLSDVYRLMGYLKDLPEDMPDYLKQGSRPLRQSYYTGFGTKTVKIEVVETLDNYSVLARDLQGTYFELDDRVLTKDYWGLVPEPGMKLILEYFTMGYTRVSWISSKGVTAVRPISYFLFADEPGEAPLVVQASAKSLNALWCPGGIPKAWDCKASDLCTCQDKNYGELDPNWNPSEVTPVRVRLAKTSGWRDVFVDWRDREKFTRYLLHCTYMKNSQDARIPIILESPSFYQSGTLDKIVERLTSKDG